MPAITLSDSTFTKLKSIAEPFVDTPESVVERLIDKEIERRDDTRSGNDHYELKDSEVLVLNPDSHESLFFTRVLSARIDGRDLHRPKWNSFMDHLHVLGFKRLGTFEALKRVTGAGVRQGRFEQDGYRYLPEADISIQGVDANNAWSHSLGVARAIRVPIRITFEWRHKEGAARPGRCGALEWKPSAP